MAGLEALGLHGLVAAHPPGAVVPFLCLDGLGECVGYLAGPGRSLAELEDMEIRRERFMHPQDRPQYLQHCLEAASE